MKYLIAVALLAVCALAPCAVRAQDDVASAIVAIVNKDVITSKQVLDRANAMLKDSGNSIPAAQRDEVRRNIIRDSVREIVEERLLLAEAKRLTDAFPAVGKYIDKEVEKRVEEERLDAGGEIEFQRKLKAMGQTGVGYADKIREDLLRRQVLIQFVLRDLTASPTELLEYYRAHPEQCREPAQVKYRQIFVPLSDYDGDRERTRKKAAEIVSKLAENYDFGELARKNAYDEYEKNGGVWDWQNQGVRPEPIDKALLSLELDKVSDPIESDKGFTILKVEGRKPGRMRPFEEVQPLIERTLLAQKRLERYDALMKRLYQENYVEIMELAGAADRGKPAAGAPQ